MTNQTESLIDRIMRAFCRLDVELFYDYATKEYGLRQVKRCRFKRKDGWREYVGDKKAFVIPQNSLLRIIGEAPQFVRKRP